jgi:hypothetical protein
MSDQPADLSCEQMEALAAALTTIEEKAAANLAEFTETGLGHTVGAEIWKGMMATRTYPFVSQMRLQGREEGREEGRLETLAAAILKVLDGRGIAVDGDTRTRIASCRDADVLDTWLDRAVIVAEASDLFA